MKNWLRRAEGSEVFFHNELHGLYLRNLQNLLIIRNAD